MENQIIQKKPKRNPTPKQTKAAKAIIENLYRDKPQELGIILENIGYSPSIAKNPQMVTQTEGFKMALANLGLTEELITTSLVSDIKGKPKARVKELTLGADILGMRKAPEDEKPRGTNTYNFIFNQQFLEKIKPLEDALIAQFKNVKPPETT